MKNIPAKLLLIFFAAVFFLSGISPSVLEKEIAKLDADTVLVHGNWGFCAMTGDSGKIIAAHNLQQSLVPASTLKILTTSTALGLLGPDFKYETKIEYDGIYDSLNGIIHGNVYLKGAGDPTLNSSRFSKDDTISLFRSLPFRLTSEGIKKIEGDIIGDASCFSDNPVPDGWTWSDIGQYYGAGTCGLAYSDNSVRLFFNSMKDSCTLTRTFPVPEDVIYRSDVTADGKKDEALVYGAPFGNIFYVHGSIPAGKKEFEVKAAHPDPAYQCAKDFYMGLIAQGISISGKAKTVRRMQVNHEKINTDRKTLSVIYSPPLSSIVEQTNINSDNTYAEQLLLTLGLLKGEGGNTGAGIEVVKNYWKDLGVDLSGLNMTDGSGLSRSNGITPLIQAKILRKISLQSWFPYFFKSLPVAGRSGSMSSLCKGTPAENNMHAKTGYINRARGYAGYVKTKSGKMICFSLLANNYTCSPAEMKKRLERILTAMSEMD